MRPYSVIIPAAGSGSRMGAAVPKVLLPITSTDGRGETSILRHTVSVFASDPACQKIVVCVPVDWRAQCDVVLQGLSKVTTVIGGDSRQESVHRGVELLAGLPGTNVAMDLVLVHDAARVCVTPVVVERVVAGAHALGAVTAAVPVVDSLCRVNDDCITGYVEREGVWAIQTPQGFVLADLLAAHRSARADGFVAGDDAGLVARARQVHIVEGDHRNVKITRPMDLEVARRFVQQEGGGVWSLE